MSNKKLLAGMQAYIDGLKSDAPEHAKAVAAFKELNAALTVLDPEPSDFMKAFLKGAGIPEELSAKDEQLKTLSPFERGLMRGFERGGIKQADE